MNCAGVVNCACENKDRAGVNANCVGVDLDEICTCVDNDCMFVRVLSLCCRGCGLWKWNHRTSGVLGFSGLSGSS